MNLHSSKKSSSNGIMIAWAVTVVAAVIVFIFMFGELSEIEKEAKALTDTYTQVISDLDESGKEVVDKVELGQEESEKEVSGYDDLDEESEKEVSGHDDSETKPEDTGGDTDKNTSDYSDNDHKGEKVIALTFDDGPFLSTTDRIIETLNKYNVKATFFMVGYNIDTYSDLCKKIYENGFEIGNHSKSHKNLTELSNEEIKEELDYVTNALNEIVPVGEPLIRPPYGSYDDNLKSIVKAPMICWSIDSEDWKSRDKDSIVERVKKEAKDGRIILMHDIYESTADAVEVIIPWLIDEGYSILTVSELLKTKGIEPVAGEVYRYVE